MAFALARMIEDLWVRCEIVGVDPEGRMLGICRTIGGQELNREMVAQGWAAAHRPHTSEYLHLPEEDAARSAGPGIWYGAPVPPENHPGEPR